MTLVRFPALPGTGAGLGVGLDLPWDGGGRGFGCDAAGGDALGAPVERFLRAHAGEWAHVFFSWQARDRAPPRLEDYRPAWDQLADALPAGLPRGLHHTALDLGALAPRDRGALLGFTADLCREYHLRWINEDVGLWSLAGRPLPYPLPPLLTAEGLAATVANVRACQTALDVPLVLEFPGFARGVSLVLGEMDAYDFFRVLAERTGAPVTLDVAHLLSWRWWRGCRGGDLYDGVDRLPVGQCFEIHLSGCEISGERFIDAHHGRLMDEQFELLERLLPRCPRLRAVTFEDPRFDAEGRFEPDSLRSWRRLQEVMRPWMSNASAA